MAIRIGDTIVKKVYIGDTEIEDGNVHGGSDELHFYEFTLSFVDAVTNGTFDTTAVTYKGYVGETFTDTRDASANNNYTLSSTTTTKSGTNSSDVDITASSGVTSSWTVTMPQGGGTATITSTASAAIDQETYKFSQWTGACAATTAGVVTCTAGGATSATAANVAARVFNDGCITKHHTNRTVTVTVPAGYSNSGGTVTGSATITQPSLPQVNVGDPTGSISQLGVVTFNESGYSAPDVVHNSGCAMDVEIAWTYTATSGDFCNNTDNGDVTLNQAKLAGTFSLTSSATVIAASTASTAFITNEEGCGDLTCTHVASSGATAFVKEGDLVVLTFPANTSITQAQTREGTCTKDGTTETYTVTQNAATKKSLCSLSSLTIASTAALACNGNANAYSISSGITLSNPGSVYSNPSCSGDGVSTGFISDSNNYRQVTGDGVYGSSQACSF